MNRIKTKVLSSEVGKFDVDSITVSLDSKITSICFAKKDNVAQYDGKEIYLINNNGIYTIELYTETANIKK